MKQYFQSGASAFLAGFIALTLAIWLAAFQIIGLGHGYLGQSYPLYPGLTVGPVSLLMDAALQAAPWGLAAGTLATFLPRLRWLPILLGAQFLIGYYVGIDGIASLFAVDFGNTWAPGEAARALMTDPLWTPLTLFGGLPLNLGLWRLLRP